MLNFLWSGSNAKIALKTLQSAKTCGGLKLVDLKKRDISLKITWIQILEKEHTYAETVFSSMHYIGKNVFRCYIQEQDVEQLNITNKFWRDVIKSWCNFNYYNNFQIENQIIWLNSRIKIGGKLVFWKKAWDKGLVYVYQLFDNNSLMSALKMFRTYDVDFVSFQSLISALPVEWKNYYMTEQVIRPTTVCNYDVLKYRKNLSAYVYDILTSVCGKVLDKKQAWMADMDTIISTDDFLKSFRNMYITTNTNKYRSFQYRLLNRGIVTNVKLHQWNILESPMCTLCDKYPKSIVHLLWQCNIVKDLWKCVENYIKKDL